MRQLERTRGAGRVTGVWAKSADGHRRHSLLPLGALEQLLGKMLTLCENDSTAVQSTIPRMHRTTPPPPSPSNEVAAPYHTVALRWVMPEWQPPSSPDDRFAGDDSCIHA